MWIVSTNAIAFARCGHLYMHTEGRICTSIIVIPSAQALWSNTIVALTPFVNVKSSKCPNGFAMADGHISCQ